MTVSDATMRLVREALEAAPHTFGHNHWDYTMMHGAGCKTCIAQFDAKKLITKALAALDAEREKPQWVDAKQVNEQCEWWWWNGDPDSAPVVVSVMWSGFTDTYFAPMGQLGWTHPQDVIGMGGVWQKIDCPETPKETP